MPVKEKVQNNGNGNIGALNISNYSVVGNQLETPCNVDDFNFSEFQQFDICTETIKIFCILKFPGISQRIFLKFSENDFRSSKRLEKL